MNKKFILTSVLLALPLFIGNAFAEPVNTYDSQGRITKTVYDDGSYDDYYYNYWNGTVEKYRHNSDGNTFLYLYYTSEENAQNDVADYKRETLYDENGNYTETQWGSAEAVANDRPDYRYEGIYDEATSTYTSQYYYSADAIENNAPDQKTAETWDDNGNMTSQIQWNSPEAVANNAPDYKWTEQYNAEQGVYIELTYTSSESIQNDVPDYRGFYSEETGNYITYDKDGNFSGANGYNRIIYDEQGRISRSGYVGPCAS